MIQKLSDTKIVDLAEQLITFIPHSLLTLDNVKYNERQSIGWSQVKMKAVLHNEVIKNVLQKLSKINWIILLLINLQSEKFINIMHYQHYLFLTKQNLKQKA